MRCYPNQMTQQVIDAIDKGIAVLNTGLEYEVWNSCMERLTGIPADNVLGRRPLDVFPNLDRTGAIEAMENALNGETTVMPGRRWDDAPKGARPLISEQYQPLMDATGRVTGVLVFVDDISRKKKEEDKARACQTIVSGSSDLMSFVDPNYTYLAVNQAFLTAHQKKEEEVVGQTIEGLYGPEVYRIIKPNVDACLSGRRINYKNWFDYPGLDRRYMDVVLNPYRDRHGSITGVIVNIRDLTDLQQAIEAHREAVDIINKGPAVAFLWANEPGWPVELVTENVETLCGYTAEDFLSGRVFYNRVVHPEDLERISTEVSTHSRNKGVKRFRHEPYRIITRQGRIKWIEDNTYIRRDGQGRITHYQGIVLDITARKRFEEALENRILALTRPLDSPEGIAFEDLFDLTDIQRLQDLFAEAFGVAAILTRPDGAAITKSSNPCELCRDIILPSTAGALKCYHSDQIIGANNPSGPSVQYCLSAGLCNAGASINVGGHHVASWLIGQVRHEEYDEEKVRQYAGELSVPFDLFKEKYLKVPVMSRGQFEKVAQVLFTLSRLISTAAYQNLQQARFIAERKRTEETLHKYERIVSNSHDFMALINRDYMYEAINESLLSAHGRSREEVLGRSVADLFGEQFFLEKYKPRFDQALAGQKVHYQDSFDLAALGRRILDVNLLPLFDPGGRVEGVVATSRDITETRKLEEQLAQSQKIESIGTLAGGIAHEINNPINGIMNYAQLIIDRSAPESPNLEMAREIILETERIAGIVRNLLTFARHEKKAHSQARLTDIVGAVASLIRTVIRHDQIDMRIDIPDNLPVVKCRSQQIQQVIMNLLTNARDALNEKYQGYDPQKRIEITARQIEKDGDPFIRTTVKDSGTGISPQVRDRVFDPFFTTKPKETGTGLGLSISYGIVKEHRGELIIESQPGQFTHVHLDLPVDNGW